MLDQQNNVSSMHQGKERKRKNNFVRTQRTTVEFFDFFFQKKITKSRIKMKFFNRGNNYKAIFIDERRKRQKQSDVTNENEEKKTSTNFDFCVKLNRINWPMLSSD